MTTPAALPEIHTVSGAEPGPTLALLGGVHGDELEGVLAVRRVADLVTGMPFRGRVVYAAPAHPSAWQQNCRHSPTDGKNLARVFPGREHGSVTERIAAHLTAGLIAGTDLLIDLHSAGHGFDMPLLVGYHSTGPLAEAAAAAARAFAAPLIWRHPESADGRSLSAAEALGVPSLYVESHGGGRLRRADLDAYVAGVLRVMTHLAMVDAADIPDGLVPSVGPAIEVSGDGNTDEGMTSPADGYFVAAVEVGEMIDQDQSVGYVVDDRGSTVAEIRARHGGIVMLLRRTASIAAGDTLAVVAERAARSPDRSGAEGSGDDARASR